MSFPSNTQILLANRNPNAPLTPYDGKVGAIIGCCIYTTPNETFVPLSLHGDREVLVRQDYRYGPDDHTLWPQPYSNLAPHLGVIPRKPTDPQDPLAPLWRNPQESHFLQCPLQGSIASGIGKLDPAFFSAIEPIALSLRERFVAYAKSLPEGKEPNAVAASLERISGFALRRLSSLITSWHQIRFTVTELQRLLLELRGCLDYIEIYKPMIDSSLSAPSNPTTISTIGTFTTSIRVVEEFSAVGIPVWFIRQHNSAQFGNNVLAEVVPLDYRGCLVMEKHPDFPAVFKGKCDADSFTIVTHVLQFSRFWLRRPDPFSENPTSPSTGPQASSSGSSRGPDGRPPAKKFKATNAASSAPGGRDKFMPLDSPFAPFSIPAWAVQLQHVDRTQPPAIERLPRGGFYTFPDPGLFIGVQTDRKRQFMIEQYSRIAPLWQSRTDQSPGMAMSNDQWRNLLSIDFRLPAQEWATGETRTAARHREALKVLLPTGCTKRVIDKNEPYLLMGSEEYFETGILPPAASLRKFHFALYWLNFRAELIALDRVAHLDLVSDQAKLEREHEIDLLLPGQTFILPLFNPPNFGLAADSLRERLPFLRTFARIMSMWKGDKPSIFKLGRHKSGADEDISLGQAAQLEMEVALFYCQQFFNYFRRAAQIPHRLYSPSVQDSGI